MYTYETIQDIIQLSNQESLTFGQVVLRAEMELTEAIELEVITKLKERLTIFRESVQSGLQDTTLTPSGMSGGQAAHLQQSKPMLLNTQTYTAMTYAIAVSEANAKMYRIVACPTAGSCGILPGCFMALEDVLHISEDALVEGLLAASGIGNVVSTQACVAGAVGGCQAECGTAAAMTAGGIVAILGGTAKQVGEAAALALKNVLGLVCDPVAGLVEVPCIKRNGMHAVHSLTAAEMALAGLTSRIPVDEVILAMYTIGKAMPAALRETSDGGLAVTPTGIVIANRVKNL